MNKKELAKIKRPEADEELMQVATEAKEKYIATTEKTNDLLIINFFTTNDLRKGIKTAKFRTFFESKDYISQDLKETKTKWKTGCLENILQWNWYCEGMISIIHTRKNVEKDIKDFFGLDKEDVWEAIRRIQKLIMENRIQEKHRKELSSIDEKMKEVPELPEDFEHWIQEYGMYQKRYLIYGKKEGYCTQCRNYVKVRNAKNMKRETCTSCGSEVTFKAAGWMPSVLREETWICLIQKTPHGFVERYFLANIRIQKSIVGYERKIYYEENVRRFREEGKTTFYEKNIYKQRGSLRWCPNSDKWNCTHAVVYTENLTKLFKGTEYQYSALDIYQKNKNYEPIPVWSYLDQYPVGRYLEALVKINLTNLVEGILERGTLTYKNGTKLTEILDLQKPYINILRELNGPIGIYTLLKQCETDNIMPSKEEIQEFYTNLGADDETLGLINAKKIKISKFIKYIEKQHKKIPEVSPCHMGYASSKKEGKKRELKNIVRDWKDYLSWCVSLKYNMQDEYTNLPPDLSIAHNRVHEEYTKERDKIKKEEQKKMEEEIKLILEETKQQPEMQLKTKELILIVPKTAEEIREEGRSLHHCVGTYVERVAKGKTMILFVRKTESPEKSYYTLEVNDGEVVQCRGKNNCSMNKKVEAFVKAFEKKMQNQNQKKVS